MIVLKNLREAEIQALEQLRLIPILPSRIKVQADPGFASPRHPWVTIQVGLSGFQKLLSTLFLSLIINSCPICGLFLKKSIWYLYRDGNFCCTPEYISNIYYIRIYIYRVYNKKEVLRAVSSISMSSDDVGTGSVTSIMNGVPCSSAKSV